MYGATTDNARNNAVVNIMGITHLGCVGHTLQLSVNKGLLVMQCGKSKKIMQHFKGNICFTGKASSTSNS